MALKRSIALDYAECFENLRDDLPGATRPWLAKLRADAIDRLRDQGLPSQKVEEWKYTSLTGLAAAGFAPADAARLTASETPGAALLGDVPAHRLVFVNGRFDAACSAIGTLPEGVTLTGLASVLADGSGWLEDHLGQIAPLNGNALVALNTAFMGDGCVLRLGDGVALDEPVHVVSVASAGTARAAFHPRLLVVAERNTRATLIESHLSVDPAASYWSNPLAEIELGEGASLAHYKLQNEARSSYHVALTRARLAAGSRYANFVMTGGAALSRNEIHASFEGPNGECSLTGGTLLRGAQHADATTLIDHAHPRCTSREIYKNVLDESAHGVFQGKIVVRPDAQKTDGHQLSRTLLLSDKAEIDTKPELEIFADDVKCSHGATAGELDDDALFYFCSRGIAEARARHLLIEAFMDEVIAPVEIEPLRTSLSGEVARWLAAGEAA